MIVLHLKSDWVGEPSGLSNTILWVTEYEVGAGGQAVEVNSRGEMFLWNLAGKPQDWFGESLEPAKAKDVLTVSLYSELYELIRNTNTFISG